jgi:transcription-repair coupling factor (superfamily II helicase)
MNNFGSNINKNLEESNIISVLYCLYQFDDLKNAIINQVNNNQDNIVNSIINFFKNNRDKSINKILSNTFGKLDYKDIILNIFEKLNKNLNKIPKNFNFFNLSNENEEIKKIKEFIAKNIDGSIIDNSFYCIEEFKYYCSVQKKTEYKFKMHPFISVKLNDLEKIKKFSNLFIPIKNGKCHFCGNNNDKCFVENKIITFPKILIIVLDGAYQQKFQNNWIIDHEYFK